MAALEVTPKKKRVRHKRVDDDGVKDIDLITDEAYQWLKEQGLVVNTGAAPWVVIVCPWHDAHTWDGDTAGFSPAWYGGRGRGFNCFHGHCADKKINDLLLWIYRQGGPDIQGPQIQREGSK